MKTLKESILSDIDVTLNKTDELLRIANSEFDALKTHMLNVRNYDNWKSRTGYHRYKAELYVPTLCSLLGLNDKINTMEIVFVKHITTGRGVTYWSTKIRFYEMYNDSYNDQPLKLSERMIDKRPSAVITNKLTSVFKDLNTFIKFVKNNT